MLLRIALDGVFKQTAEAAKAAVDTTATSAQIAPLAVTMPEWSIFHAIGHAGLAEQLVMACLLVFSLSSWAVIFYQWRLLAHAVKQSQIFINAFETQKRLDAIYQKAQNLPQSPLSQIFKAGYVELSRVKKKADGANLEAPTSTADMLSVERAMLRVQQEELNQLEQGISFLATVASTAPFLGLLGTVVGIIHAFGDIGNAGNANLATVAPSMGGALVATAIGLFAAIPAVIAYNYFTSRLRHIDIQMQSFCADFLNIIKRHFF